MKRKLSAKTILLYVTYVSLSVIAGGVFEGAISFGLFVGALYSANPIIATVIYLASSVAYGWTSLMHASVRAGVMLVFWLIHRLVKRKIGKLNLLLYVVLANVFYCVYNFVDYFTLFDRLLYVACGIAFCYVCIYVFRAVFVRGLAYKPALDETICIALFTVVCGYCISQQVFWGLNLIYLLATYAILFCSVCFSSQTALICATLFGIGNLLASGTYDCFAFLVVCALAVITANKVSRYLSSLCVVAVDVLFTYFLGLHNDVGMLSLVLTFSAALIFAVIPTSVYNFARDYSYGTSDRYLATSLTKRVGDNVSRRLYRLSDIFLSMKNAFFSMSKGSITNEQAQAAIVKQCSEVVCRD
ncbi:MAG: hypothetical protein K2M64_03835, partial [Clostridia bacterium]|nr:hypothetical protein [Clostridia bacterium]